jgi:hypothetical protein
MNTSTRELHLFEEINTCIRLQAELLQDLITLEKIDDYSNKSLKFLLQESQRIVQLYYLNEAIEYTEIALAHCTRDQKVGIHIEWITLKACDLLKEALHSKPEEWTPSITYIGEHTV